MPSIYFGKLAFKGFTISIKADLKIFRFSSIHIFELVLFYRQNLASADDVCFQYSVVGDVLNGLGSSNIVLAPIIVLSCFAGLKLIISLIALANFVRLTGKVSR